MRGLAFVAIGLLSLAAALLGAPARSEEVDLERLRQELVDAAHPHTVDQVLDSLADRIGLSPGFADAGTFGDWLGRLPEDVAARTRVKLRRGWAYLAAGRPEAAQSLLEGVAGSEGDEAAVAAGYLGELARQQGEPGRALELLAEAARRGWRDFFVVESARKAAFDLHEATPSGEVAKGLPDYVEALQAFLEVFEHPLLQATLARWLLDDYLAFAVPGRERAQIWARAAARHALAAAVTAPVSGADARLAFDAAQALAPEDEATRGRTLRYELLAEAWRLGNRPAEDTHEIPQVVALLAEAALRDGAYVLAHRLARQRLSISDSPLARRVLDLLPPDVGD